VTRFQSDSGCDSIADMMHCTGDLSFRISDPLNNFVWFQVGEPLNGNVGDLGLAQLVRILWLQDGVQMRCIDLLQKLWLENKDVCLPCDGLCRVSTRVFHRN